MGNVCVFFFSVFDRLGFEGEDREFIRNGKRRYFRVRKFRFDFVFFRLLFSRVRRFI